MATKNISLALIGAGGIAGKWVKAIDQTANCVLKAVVDTDPTKAKILAKKFNGCDYGSKLEDVLSRPDIEAVIVAVPHKFLAPISRRLLSAGKHVLCEKPGATNPHDMKAVMVAARRFKKVYMVGFNHRFHAAFLRAKKLLDQGKIGQPLFARARYGFGGRPGYNREWRFNKSLSGGGEVIDQGVHMIDLARCFLGEFTDVKAFTANLFWKGDVEDNGFILLKSSRGRIAAIHVSWTNWKWIHSFEIIGSAGYFYIEGLDQRYGGPERLVIGRRDLSFKNPPREKTIVFEKEQSENSFARELKEFLLAVREKRSPVPGGQDAYEVLKIIEKIYGEK